MIKPTGSVADTSSVEATSKPSDNGDGKLIACVCIYLLAALFTNSYAQSYRFEDWDSSVPVGHPSPAPLMLIGATLGWPVYWASRAATAIVEIPKQQ